jgi:calcineurin-like phosphoesterase family protein
MPRQSLDWVIADTHFNHLAMQRLAGWPKDWMDRIFTQWKHLVAEQDYVYHLGDVIFYHYPDLENLLAALPGTKILCMGNHDHKPAKWYMRQGFAFAGEMVVTGNVLFSHKPVKNFPDGVDYNIHGHLHGATHRDTPKLHQPELH